MVVAVVIEEWQSVQHASTGWLVLETHWSFQLVFMYTGNCITQRISGCLTAKLDSRSSHSGSVRNTRLLKLWNPDEYSWNLTTVLKTGHSFVVTETPVDWNNCMIFFFFSTINECSSTSGIIFTLTQSLPLFTKYCYIVISLNMLDYGISFFFNWLTFFLHN